MKILKARQALLATVFAAAPISLAAAQTYTYTSVIVPGSVFTTISAINTAGIVLGSWYDSSYTEHGYMIQNGVVTSFDAPGAANGTIANGINAKGEIVGGYYDASFGGHGYTMVIKKGKPVFTTVDAPGALNTTLSEIDSAGVIFGQATASTYQTYVFSLSKGTYTTLISQNSPALSAASANGKLAGTFYGNYPTTGYVYAAGKLVSIPGTKGSSAYGINSYGTAVGAITSSSGGTECFVFAKNKLTTLLPTGATSAYCYGINDPGSIVGISYDSTYNATGFVYTAGTYTTLSVPNGTHTVGNVINVSGQVAGTFTDANNITEVFVATPSH